MSREGKIVEALLEWHITNRRSFPWRDEEDPYKVLVAEFFLQRTPAERVAEVFPSFIRSYPTPNSLASANPQELMIEYRSLGLLKRFDWLVKAMKIVCDQYNGKIPCSKELLQRIPGVGIYTASAVLCFAFKHNVEIVDANVIRVYTRLFNARKTSIRSIANSILPEDHAHIFNEALLDFSAIICKKNPQCHNCVINQYCRSYTTECSSLINPSFF